MLQGQINKQNLYAPVKTQVKNYQQRMYFGKVNINPQDWEAENFKTNITTTKWFP